MDSHGSPQIHIISSDACVFFLVSFPCPPLLSIYTSLLDKLIAVSPYLSWFQYVLEESNSPSFLYSLCGPESPFVSFWF